MRRATDEQPAAEISREMSTSVVRPSLRERSRFGSHSESLLSVPPRSAERLFNKKNRRAKKEMLLEKKRDRGESRRPRSKPGRRTSRCDEKSILQS